MNKYKYKVSVIMPVYGVKDYIELSVESICIQEFRDFELILVDDESPDNSISLAEHILSDYGNVKYKVISQKNKGLPGARNAGIKAAEGKYICYIDSDDIVTPDFLLSLYNACETYKVQASFTEYEIVKLKNRKGSNDTERGIKILSNEELLYKNMMRSVRIHLCAMMISYDFIIENGLYFNESLRFGEEVDYTWRMFPLLKKVCYIQSPKYKYLVRQESLMTSQKAERVVRLLNNMHIVIKALHSKGLLCDEKLIWVEDKIYFEKIHAFGQHSKYCSFKSLLESTGYKNRLTKLYDFPDKRIALLSRIGYSNKHLLWIFFKLV